jgi:hypothetical protein
MKKTITHEELKELYDNNTNKFCCQTLGITQATLLKYLVTNGIPTKGNTKPKVTIITKEK